MFGGLVLLELLLRESLSKRASLRSLRAILVGLIRRDRLAIDRHVLRETLRKAVGLHVYHFDGVGLRRGKVTADFVPYSYGTASRREYIDLTAAI